MIGCKGKKDPLECGSVEVWEYGSVEVKMECDRYSADCNIKLQTANCQLPTANCQRSTVIDFKAHEYIYAVAGKKPISDFP